MINRLDPDMFTSQAVDCPKELGNRDGEQIPHVDTDTDVSTENTRAYLVTDSKVPAEPEAQEI